MSARANALQPPEASAPGKRRLKLNSISACRLTTARIIRLFDNGELSEARFRALIYGLSALLGFWKEESTVTHEARIKALEEARE